VAWLSSYPKSMKILMVSKACIVGAYQKKLEELAAFPDLELTVVVPPYWRDERGITKLERGYTKGYEMVVSPMIFNGHFHLHFYPALGRIVRRVKPDLVHIDEEPYNLAAFQGIRLGERAGARTVIFTWQNILRLYPPPFNLVERYNLNHADALIAGTNEATEVWRNKGYKGPIHIIPQFGVDPDLYQPLERAVRTTRLSVLQRRSVRKPSQMGFVIGYVGRLVAEKGIELLLGAVVRLSGPWQLRILGSGPELERLEKMAQRLGIYPRVLFDRPIPSTQMPYYLSGLDALVLPSITRPNWKEQFGRVLIEAMACGVPVVGARSGAIPDVIADAGLTFAEGDVAGLTRQLTSLMNDTSLRKKMAHLGRIRVLARFTQERIAEATFKVYQYTLAGEATCINQWE
jgi:glycosyltransferase involved in cell wall biosynthesis